MSGSVPRFVLLVCVMLPFGVTSCGLLPDNPSDAYLERSFQEKYDDFSRLVVLCLDNPEILRMDMKEALVTNGDSETRIIADRPYVFTAPQYQEIAVLLDTLGLNGGLAHCPDTPGVLLFYADCGGVHPRSCKGYAFSKERMQPTVSSLDTNLPSELDSHRRAYKPLSDNWYILFEIGTAEDTRCQTTDGNRNE